MTTGITIEKLGNKYVARFPFSYTLKDLVKAAGFRFDPNTKLWWTTDPEIAAKFATPDMAARMLAQQQAAIRASSATDADLDVPAPEGLAYLPYQRAGIAYAMTRSATLIGDEMGLGKTIQAIGVINADPSINKVLVICPASLKLNWRNELKKWLVRPMTVAIVNGGGWYKADIMIINYDILSKHRTAIDLFAPDLLICDECHYLKNPKAARTHQVLGQWTADAVRRLAPINARRRLFLTGTPILNRPIELWPLVHALDRAGLGRNWRQFTIRYCGAYQGRYGWDVSGAANLGELQAKLRSSIMVRRLKADVLSELPPKRRQIVTVEPDAKQRAAIAVEQQGYDAAMARTEAARAALELAKADDDPEAYKQAVRALRDTASAAFTEISKLRHDTAVAKIPAVIEHLTEALEASPKIVVMAHHHDVIHALAEAFPGAAVLTGETPIAKRQAEVERFQQDPRCTVFLGSIRAAGLGLTLTASSHVVFCELDWTPGNMTQAEDRCHRIGQRDNVLVQHLVLDGSLDARMAQILVEKQEIIDQALDKDLELPEVPVFADQPATKDATPAKLATEAETITWPRALAILEGLRFLAARCDGAYALDGAGFNKLDSHIGKALAACQRLSPKQAALGLRIVTKYRRQIPADIMSVITPGEAS